MKSSLILFLLTIVLFVSCKQVAWVEPNNHQKLMDKENLSEHVGEKVQLDVKICEMEMQHLLVPSLDGKRTYICLDRWSKAGERFGQLLAYTSDENILKKDFGDDKLTAFGTVQVMSGAGKGGGTHDEYYLELYIIR